MSDPKGILESLNLVTVLVDAIIEAKADGKIDILDLPKLAPVIMALRQALPDLKDIPQEMKSLDSQAIQEILSSLAQVVEKVLQLIAG